MEYEKINNLIGSESEILSKFATVEYVRVNYGELIEDAEDLDIVMPMYNLL